MNTKLIVPKRLSWSIYILKKNLTKSLKFCYNDVNVEVLLQPNHVISAYY